MIWRVHQSNLRQQITPARVLGCVSGGIRFLSSIAMLASTAVGGWLGRTIGLRATLVAGGASVLLAAAVVLPARPKRVQPSNTLSRRT